MLHRLGQDPFIDRVEALARTTRKGRPARYSSRESEGAHSARAARVMDCCGGLGTSSLVGWIDPLAQEPCTDELRHCLALRAEKGRHAAEYHEEESKGS